MANFLDSSVLPGDSVPKHEHRKLFIILIVAVLIAVAILVSLLVYSQDSIKDTVLTNPTASIDPRIEELKKYEVKLTDQQKIESVNELKQYQVTLTEQEKAAKILELQKYSNK